jgi:exonuclease III
MKIATYNVRNFYDAGTSIDRETEEVVKEDFFNKRVAYFVEKFRALNLDIICLQEIGGEKGVSIIGDILGYNYFFAKPNKRGIRMAVLYKKELSEKIRCESFSFGDISVPDLQEEGDMKSFKPMNQRRDVLVCDFDNYNGKKLRIVTFHLKSLLPLYFENDDKENDEKAFSDAKFRSVFHKIVELRAMRTFVDKSLNEGRELVLLGDFNEDHKASSISILKDSNKEDRFLFDILTGFKGDDATHIYRDTKLTFDTILVSNNLKNSISSVSVNNEDLKCYSGLPFGEIENVIEPDHAMVVLELK